MRQCEKYDILSSTGVIIVTEFEKQMLAMMQEMKASLGSLESKVDRLEQRMDSLENKVDSLEQRMEAGFAELREADAAIIEGVSKIVDKLGDQQYATAEKVNAVEAVVSGLVFDVALLKRKVG